MAPKKYFNHQRGAWSTQKLVKIHNRYEPANWGFAPFAGQKPQQEMGGALLFLCAPGEFWMWYGPD